MKWTQQKLNQLKDLVSINWTDRQIGNLLGLSEGAIRMARSRHQVPRPTRKDSNLTRALDRTIDGTESTDVTADLASRLAELQGLVTHEEPTHEPLSDTRLKAFLDDPEAFTQYFGVELHPYQKEAVELILRNDRTILCWSRQGGKDMVTSLYSLWTALTQPQSIVVCVGPSQRQSDLWLGRLREYALSKPEIRSSVTELSQTEIAFSNGSRVYSLPGIAHTIRGFSRVSLLIFNESAYIGEDVYRASSPFLAASAEGGAKLICISTPWGQQGYFWNAWNSPLFAKSHISADQCPHISKDFLEAEKASMDSLSFASEYEAEFLSGQTSYYPTEVVSKCTKAYDLTESPLPEYEGMAVYCGWDPARVEGGDRSVITILGITEDHGRVLWIRAFEGVPYDKQVAYMLWLHSNWRFRKVYVDASAHAIVDSLTAKMLPVEAVSFSMQGKVELHSRLKSAFEGGRITIPRHPDLLRELSGFEYKISEAGNLLLHGGRDDHVDSLALAARNLTAVAFRPAIFGIEMPGNRIVGRARPEKNIVEQYFPLDTEGRKPDFCSVCNEPVGFPRVRKGERIFHPACQDRDSGCRVLPNARNS